MQKEQILETAFCGFANLGIKGVSMDYIAKTLQISKKTVYDSFESKELLLKECIQFNIKENIVQILKEEEAAPSTLAAIVGVNRLVLQQTLSLCPAFHHEIQRFSDMVNLIDRRYIDFIHTVYSRHFTQGIEEGIFPLNYNCQSTLLFFDAQILNLCKTSHPANTQALDTYRLTILTYLAGICTDKGRQNLNALESLQSSKLRFRSASV